MKYRAKIKRDGTLEFLGAPPPGLVLPAGTTKRRFSEIVPVHPVKRAAFRLLRWMFGEDGRVARWTRGWRCRWEAIILLGPARGKRCQCEHRDMLLFWEQQIWRNN